jgi:hypothetical protein
MASFDVSAVSALHYRNMVRLSRWSAVGFFVFFAGLAVWRLVVQGYQPILLLLVPLEGFLGWFAAVHASPGPVELRRTTVGFDFVYPHGRVRSVSISGSRLHLRLAERVLKTNPSWFEKAIDDAQYFAFLGWDQVAITPPAYEFLLHEIQNAGFVPRTRMKPYRPVGFWRIQEFGR